MISAFQVCHFYSVIKHCVSCTDISFHIYYYRHQVISIFINMIHISGLITVEFSFNDRYGRKNGVPILHCDGVFDFAALRQSFKVFQYLFAVIISIHPQTIFSASPTKCNTHFYFINFSLLSPQNPPN